MSAGTMADDRARSLSAIFRAHPPGLRVLISLKVWELFSYQGMRAFLVLYLIDAFGLSDSGAALIFGSYAALVLAMSVLGGYCADRWLGPKEAMLSGAVLIMAGHLTLATDNLLVGLGIRFDFFQLFCLGLAAIAVGTGLLKPNVLTMIGRLYRVDDPRREIGYYVYYIGVNIGSLLAPIVCGGLASRYGWTWGFAAAAIGMALGLVSFIVGRRHVRAVDGPDSASAGRAVPRKRIYAAMILALLAATFLVQHGFALGVLLAVTMAGGLGVLLRRAYRAGAPRDFAMVLRFLALIPVPIMFEILFEQLATSVTLFADRAVDLRLWGRAISAPQLLSLNSLFVLCLLPVVATIWSRLAARDRDPRPFAKFAIGFGFIALSFVTLALATHVGPAGARVDLAWVVAAYLFLTLGELCIAPLAFSLVGKMVPEGYAGLAMGLILLSFAIGNFLSSVLAGMVSLPAGLTVAVMKAAYGQFFLGPALIASMIAVIALAARRIAIQGRN